MTSINKTGEILWVGWHVSVDREKAWESGVPKWKHSEESKLGRCSETAGFNNREGERPESGETTF